MKAALFPRSPVSTVREATLVAGPAKEKHQGGPRADPLQDQSGGDGGRGRGADIQGDAEGQHDQHRDQAPSEIILEQGLRDQGRDQTGQDQTQKKPARDIVPDLSEGVSQPRQDLFQGSVVPAMVLRRTVQPVAAAIHRAVQVGRNRLPPPSQ